MSRPVSSLPSHPCSAQKIIPLPETMRSTPLSTVPVGIEASEPLSTCSDAVPSVTRPLPVPLRAVPPLPSCHHRCCRQVCDQGEAGIPKVIAGVCPRRERACWTPNTSVSLRQLARRSRMARAGLACGVHVPLDDDENEDPGGITCRLELWKSRSLQAKCRCRRVEKITHWSRAWTVAGSA